MPGSQVCIFKNGLGSRISNHINFFLLKSRSVNDLQPPSQVVHPTLKRLGVQHGCHQPALQPNLAKVRYTEVLDLSPVYKHLFTESSPYTLIRRPSVRNLVCLHIFWGSDLQVSGFQVEFLPAIDQVLMRPDYTFRPQLAHHDSLLLGNFVKNPGTDMTANIDSRYLCIRCSRTASSTILL
uniref:Uncharacterized protein n=1 Tax=Psilocybe cubensis TaxID=181762 RepID=A0A8H7XVL4_PSICU